MLNKTKAKNLRDIKMKIGKVPFFKIYKFKKFLYNTDLVLNEIKNKFYNREIAIRSSFKNEDNKNSSNAGKYLSFLNVKSKNIIDIKEIKLSFLLVKRYLLAIKYSVFVKSKNNLLFFD